MFCPVKAIIDYWNLSPNKSDALFASEDGRTNYMTGTLRNFVKGVLRGNGFGHKFSAGSLRGAGTSAVLDCGSSWNMVQITGVWSSYDMMNKFYLRAKANSLPRAVSITETIMEQVD